MRRTWTIAVGILALSALGARHAAAQWNVARLDTQRNRVLMSFGMDPALVLTLGYARSVPVSAHDVQLVGDIGLAGGHMDTHDFRARLGAQSSLLRWRSMHFTASATFITRGTQNIIYRGLNFGSDFTGTLGVYRRGWFAASEFGFDKAIITHLTHTQYYRDNFYSDARDGWYLTGGGTFHSGLAAGLARGRTELVVRGGLHATERFNAMAPPMYASVGLGVGF